MNEENEETALFSSENKIKAHGVLK
jgi:hypothetical protein